MSLVRCIWNAWALRAGLGVLAIGWAPLLLYGAYEAISGATGGNPIGLGLLMFFSTPVALALVVVGVAQGIYRYVRRR